MFKRQTPQSTTNEMETPLLTKQTVVETAVPLGNSNNDNHKNKKVATDADDDDCGGDDDKVIDTKCTLMSKSYVFGILTGLFLQAMSFYIAEYVKSSSVISSTNIMVAFTAYVFSKYWMPIALLLPAAIVAIRSRSLPSHLRLESFFDSLRFQFGLFFGSLILLSLVNFYSLASTAPWPLLMSYYAVCLTISFIALCLLQIFVNEVCANVSSIEVIVNYEQNDHQDASNNA
jgi:hypothetical protein